MYLEIKVNHTYTNISLYTYSTRLVEKTNANTLACVGSYQKYGEYYQQLHTGLKIRSLIIIIYW